VLTDLNFGAVMQSLHAGESIKRPLIRCAVLKSSDLVEQATLAVTVVASKKLQLPTWRMLRAAQYRGCRGDKICVCSSCALCLIKQSNTHLFCPLLSRDLAPRLLERLVAAAIVLPSASDSFPAAPRFDLLAQLNEVEARLEDYPETLSFVRLVNALLEVIGPLGLPAGGLGVAHFTGFVLNQVLAHLWQRAYKWVGEGGERGGMGEGEGGGIQAHGAPSGHYTSVLHPPHLSPPSVLHPHYYLNAHLPIFHHHTSLFLCLIVSIPNTLSASTVKLLHSGHTPSCTLTKSPLD